jgi:hypothetical protein
LEDFEIFQCKCLFEEIKETLLEDCDSLEKRINKLFIINNYLDEDLELETPYMRLKKMKKSVEDMRRLLLDIISGNGDKNY